MSRSLYPVRVRLIGTLAQLSPSRFVLTAKDGRALSVSLPSAFSLGDDILPSCWLSGSLILRSGFPVLLADALPDTPRFR